MSVTLITGNQDKADFFAKHMAVEVNHRKVDLVEIQSMDLCEVSEHKARQAYEIIKSPVLVEDVGLYLEALNGFPGPFIKWFELSLGHELICQIVNGLSNRKVNNKVCFAYFDGREVKFFNGVVPGRIADRPKGNNGFGFDPIFIRDGFDITFAEMSDEEHEKYSLRTSTVYPEIKKFLSSLDNA